MLQKPGLEAAASPLSRRHRNFQETVHTSVGRLTTLIAAPLGESVARPLIAVHGIARDAAAMLSHFSMAEDRLVLAPHFDAERWPRYQRLNRSRPDLALLETITTLRARGLLPEGPVDLFGFSGGAQFAHRFAMVYPHLIGELRLASAGWYTLPDETAPWPYGLGDPRSGRSRWPRRLRGALAAYLRLPIRLYVGAEDAVTDPALRRNDIVDACQGVHRLARAHAYRAAVEEAARRIGLTPDVTLAEIPGCGHDFRQCADAGAFAPSAARAPLLREA